jgi:hypothetical protein
MKLKAVPFLIAAAWLIPTAASAQLPPTMWSKTPSARPDACQFQTGSQCSGSIYTGGSYYKDARDVKNSTTWEAPTRLDRKVADEIEQAQIDYGPQDIKVAQLIWRHAQNYFSSNEYSKAKELLRKLLDMADPEIRAKLPMNRVQQMYADSADKMRPLSASKYKPFSHNRVSHFGSTYSQYLNQPNVSKTQVGRGTFVYNQPSNTPLISAANTQKGSNSGGVLVNGPNFSFRATGPTTIKLNGVDITIPAGASGTLNISNTPPRSAGKNSTKPKVQYLAPGRTTSVPGRASVVPNRGPGTFDTGGFHDLDSGFTIHSQ